MEKINGFDRQAFNVRFDSLLDVVREAEKITKPAAAELSLMVLQQLHFDGDIQPINRLLDVLTVMNRKTFVLWVKEFGGFQYSEKTGTFGKKDKAHYQEKYNAYLKALETVEGFNIWVWAATEVTVEVKPFTLDKVTDFIKNTLKKAEKAEKEGAKGFGHIDVIKAILAGGITSDDLIECLKLTGVVDVQEPAANADQKEEAA